MPELPEVETIKRELDKSLKGRVISDVEILWNKTVSPTSVINFKETVTGKKIIGLERRAKMLLIHLDKKISLVIHLKMTGHLLYGKYKLHPSQTLPLVRGGRRVGSCDIITICQNYQKSKRQHGA